MTEQCLHLLLELHFDKQYHCPADRAAVENVMQGRNVVLFGGIPGHKILCYMYNPGSGLMMGCCIAYGMEICSVSAQSDTWCQYSCGCWWFMSFETYQVDSMLNSRSKLNLQLRPSCEGRKMRHSSQHDR